MQLQQKDIDNLKDQLERANRDGHLRDSESVRSISFTEKKVSLQLLSNLYTETC